MEFFNKKSRNSLTSGIILIMFCAVVFSSALFFCSKFLVNPIYDYLIRKTSPKNPSPEIIVVAIDDQSINKIGRWAWKRTYYADMFEYLEKIAGARLIVFDSVLVSYGDKASDEEFFERYSHLEKVIPGIFFSRKAGHFRNENENELNALFGKNFSVSVEDHRPSGLIAASTYAESSYAIKEVAKVSKAFGSVLSIPDEDGVIRKAEPLFLHEGKYYPSLALAVYSQLNSDAKFKLTKNSLTSNKLKIPLVSDKNGSYKYIRWYNPVDKGYSYPYKTVSAWKIIEASKHIAEKDNQTEYAPSLFQDKIVVIGATSTAIRDIKHTPMKSDYPGVYIQATVIDNVLNNEFIIKSSALQESLFLITIVLAGFLTIFYLRPVYSAILLSMLAVGYFYICLFFAYPNNYAPDAITPVVFIACTMLLGYGYRYYTEDARRRKTRDLIAKYVSKDIMEEILRDPDKVKLDGKRSDISVLFIDIRNFTHISETTPPEKVSELLNEYFSELVPIIFSHNGTVNKFIGDAIMAVFGAPVENPEHPVCAVKCALALYDKVQELRVKWVLEQDKPDITIGIGISSGEAFVGNVGSDERFEYSVIGNTVNVANRLESFNKIYKTSILISEATYERVKDVVPAKEIDSVCVTKDSEPIKIYKLK